MLNTIRMNARGWFAKIILLSIVLVFMFWGVGNFKSETLYKVATVNGESVSFKEYSRLYRDLTGRDYRNAINLNQNMDKNFESFVLNQIIDHKLILQQAVKFGLIITDKELTDYIQNDPMFLNCNAFDILKYKSVVSKLGFTPHEFEEYNRELLLIKKFINIMYGMVSVSEAEISNWCDWYYSLINLSYVFFDFNNYTINTYDREKAYEYFKQNKEKYRTLPMNKIRYVTFNPNNYLGNVSTCESEIVKYYNLNKNNFFKEKEVNVSHILIRTGSNYQSEKQKNKAQDIFDMAVKGNNFNDLAKSYSECPSKEYGGILGNITYNSVVTPFAEKAFSMAVGEISSPIRTKFGWHIIKVNSIEEARKTSFSESRKQIENILIKSKANDYAYKSATNFLKNCYNEDDLINNTKLYDVCFVETDWFNNKGEGVTEFIKNETSIMSAISSMKIGEISDIHELDDCYLIIQVIDKINSIIPSFDDIETEIMSDYKAYEQKLVANSNAESFLASVKSGMSFEDTSKIYELSPHYTGFFTRNELIVNKDEYLQNIIFEMGLEVFKVGDMIDHPIRTEKGLYVTYMADKKEPENIKLKEKEIVANNITKMKQSKLLIDLISELRKSSKIDITYNHNL